MRVLIHIFQTVRGAVTEGRYLTFESGAYALTYSSIVSVRVPASTFSVTADKTAPSHNNALSPSLDLPC